ncbi:MAG: fumarylacetoacetate hydrolase family protein [Gemmatimonadota bacterium]
MGRTFVAIAFGILAISSAACSQASVVTADAQAPGTEYVRYEQNGTTSWGILEDEVIHQLSDAPYLGGGRTGETVQRSAVALRAPVDPINVYMTALNFRSHISGEPAPYPGLFLVPPGSIIGPEEQMLIPTDSENFHYEAEAVVVIGRDCDNVSIQEAPSCVFGVSAGNDGSARDWQGADIQWARAKGAKTFNQVGPVLVAGLDPNSLEIEGRLNGERVQGENTRDMIYNFDHMVSYISRYFPLEAGDLIWSGTMGQTRQVQVGDTYEVEIDGVGVLRTEFGQGI